MSSKFDKLVTIIIPCYNRTRFLEQTVDSAINQTHRPIEIVVVNDGSNGYHSKVINSFSQKKNVNILELPENLGLSAAREAGIRAAKGDYVVLLDDDDVMHPKMVTECLATLITKKCDVVVCKSDILEESFPLSKPVVYKRERLNQTNKRLPWVEDPTKADEFFLFHPPVNHSLLYKKHVFENNKLAPTLIYGCHEDNYLWLKLSLNKVRFGFCDFLGAYYRVHEERPEISTRSYEKSALFHKEAMKLTNDRKIKELLDRFLLTEAKTFGEVNGLRYILSLLKWPSLSLSLAFIHKRNQVVTNWKVFNAKLLDTKVFANTKEKNALNRSASPR